MTVEELNIATTSYNRMCKYKKLAEFKVFGLL